MTKNIRGLAIAAIFLGAASQAHADEVKIGTVDMQRALISVEAGKKAKAELEKEANTKTKDLQAEQAAIKKMDEEFKKQSLVMNEEARAKKQAELQERFGKYQARYMKLQGEIQQKEHDLTQPIIEKLKMVISDVAKQRGYHLILEKNENTVLFSQDKDDLTNDVIAQFNKKSG